MKIREIIVVEGKSDIIAVKRAFNNEVDVIATHGLSLGKGGLLDELEKLNDIRGIIVLTDPDYAGKRIRNIIKNHIPNAKFAFIGIEDARKKGDVGVENASDEAIVKAVQRARPEYFDQIDEYTNEDIIDNQLSGFSNSKNRRIQLCKELSIEYCNAKQLLIKLNSYSIPREEFEEALRRIND